MTIREPDDINARGRHDMPEIDVSVAIVNYRCADATIEAARSALADAKAMKIEVIVVDNASGDDSVPRFRAELDDVTVVDTGVNGGYAWGNNVAMARAKGRYVLILNPDAVLHEGTLAKAIAYLDQNPDIGVLGPSVFDENGVQDLSRFRFPTLSWLAWRAVLPYRVMRTSRYFGDQRYASLPLDQPADVDAVSGCFMIVPRRVIDAVGPMDSRFFLYSEETEWCWRIRAAGYRIHYWPEIAITHMGGGSTGKISELTATETAKSMILFFRLTRGRVPAYLATLILWFSDILRAAFFLPAQISAAGRRRSRPWQARIRFLTRALFRLPSGQITPDPTRNAETAQSPH